MVRFHVDLCWLFSDGAVHLRGQAIINHTFYACEAANRTDKHQSQRIITDDIHLLAPTTIIEQRILNKHGLLTEASNTNK